MSRRLFFIIAATIVILYFSVIIFILKPLHGAKFGLYMESTHFYASFRKRMFWCKRVKWKTSKDCPVALASFPGSGNTWMRHLLQESTGYITGSIYNDSDLFRHGFPGEHIVDGSVLVVKTHKLPTESDLCFRAAILLIRNPRDAILAEYNRQYKGHIGTVSWTVFRNSLDSSKSWPNFVSKMLDSWARFHVSWVTEFSRPLHVVLYERLLNTTRETLTTVIHFLNETVTKNEMDCAIKNREGVFRRKKKLNFDPFTNEMYRKIGRVQREVMSAVDAYLDRRGQCCQLFA